jgi:hypothetical protein
MLFQHEDWQLFLDPSTLSQKAGCRTFDMGKIVLKELVDNALDTGAQVVLTRENEWWVIADDGPGLSVTQIQRFLCRQSSAAFLETKQASIKRDARKWGGHGCGRRFRRQHFRYKPWAPVDAADRQGNRENNR